MARRPKRRLPRSDGSLAATAVCAMGGKSDASAAKRKLAPSSARMPGKSSTATSAPAMPGAASCAAEVPACASPVARPSCAAGTSSAVETWNASSWKTQMLDVKTVRTPTCHGSMRPARAMRTATPVSSAHARLPATITFLREKRSTKPPASGASKTDGSMAQSAMSEYAVTEPVVLNDQTATAKPDRPEPITETTSPARSNGNAHAGRALTRHPARAAPSARARSHRA